MQCPLNMTAFELLENVVFTFNADTLAFSPAASVCAIPGQTHPVLISELHTHRQEYINLLISGKMAKYVYQNVRLFRLNLAFYCAISMSNFQVCFTDIELIRLVHVSVHQAFSGLM